MRAAWLICRKDLRARLRDRSAILIGVVVPLGLAFIFNSIFSGISGGSVIKLGVVNADHGAVSQQFTSQVLPAVGRSGVIAIHPEATVAQARALAAKGKLAAVIVIPAGFSARVQAQEIPDPPAGPSSRSRAAPGPGCRSAGRPRTGCARPRARASTSWQPCNGEIPT